MSSKRVGGKNECNTSILVANELGSTIGEVAIADGLSISAVVAMKGMPILLTETNSLSSDVSNYMKIMV
ncbi:cell wall-binding repeat-containing protein [Clostridium disporicum]|uniref:cell wall-binding repeat-containing protein n=1 Tax=Clostridium disporicum TaxID=84024 RepID=UPI0034A5A4B9